ncbi:MAG: PEP/pyruvate-binding domain-containing protein [Gemmatimonadaceae bacterium]|nr:PEP/pyruvate-binding domain-containing protein [Gemmatimonadaceae bacterium]
MSISATMTERRYVYFFGNGSADGTRDMKATLGGKGANLAEMTNIGVPVPPGFTMTCELCALYLRDQAYPAALRDEVGREPGAARRSV